MCVRLFLEQGYKSTSVSQIVEEAGVARGSYLNLFPTKDRILLELTETMFGGQFGVARSIADSKLPPVYAYAVETAIQLTLTELNENLREIYIEAYSLPETSEYIYLHTTAELKQIFVGTDGVGPCLRAALFLRQGSGQHGGLYDRGLGERKGAPVPLG